MQTLGLERRHFDRSNGVLSVEQVYTQGRLKPCKKSDLQRRRVPLRAKVLEALDEIPIALRGPLFPGHDGGFVKHDTFRLRHWDPGLRAAGVEHRGPYACRHTFAAWSIRAGVQLFYLSRIMGTSVEMILPGSADFSHLSRSVSPTSEARSRSRTLTALRTTIHRISGR